MPLRTILKRLDAGLATVVMAACVVLLGAIVVTIAASVFSRFVIFTPLNFAAALAKYMMQWVAFLGVGLAIREGQHVLVDMLYVSMKERGQRVLLLVVSTLTVVLFAIVFWYGIGYAQSGRSLTDPFVFGISMMVPYMAVPAGAFYAVIQTLLTTYLLLSDDGTDADHHGTASI